MLNLSKRVDCSLLDCQVSRLISLHFNQCQPTSTVQDSRSLLSNPPHPSTADSLDQTTVSRWSFLATTAASSPNSAQNTRT